MNSIKIYPDYNSNIQAAKMIYPEVAFIPAENWKSSLHGNIIKKIKMIVVQREGITTNEIIKIEQNAQENGIKTKIEYIGNEKKLIETIAIIKIVNLGD